MLLVLANFKSDAVAKYLALKSRAESVDDVRAWYEALTPELLRHLILPAGGDLVAQRQLSEARKFLAEFRLAAWVTEQEPEEGHCPHRQCCDG